MVNLWTSETVFGQKAKSCSELLLQWDPCHRFCHYWSKLSCEGPDFNSRPVLLLTPLMWNWRPDKKKRWEPAISYHRSGPRCSASTITINLLPFLIIGWRAPPSESLPLHLAHGCLLRLQFDKVWPEAVKCVCGLYWLYFMIIYLSYVNACLRERKLTGRKCLKQKWLKKEGFKEEFVGPGSLKTGQGLVMSRQRHTLKQPDFGPGGPCCLTLCCCWKVTEKQDLHYFEQRGS